MCEVSYVEKWTDKEFSTDYDLFVTCLGYEQRASHIARQNTVRAAAKIALGFDYNKVFSYESNRKWYLQNGFLVEECGDSDFQEIFLGAIVHVPHETVLIDVSSFSRYRIATIISVLRNLSVSSAVDITFVYSVAHYSPPPHGDEPVLDTSPIRNEFAGWPADPGESLACVVGLGYEEGKAIGAIEFLEAGKVWLFRPIGWDSRFIRAVNRKNKDLYLQVPSANIIDYDLAHPYSLFLRLNSLVRGIINEGRVALLPFGPKMFAVVALIVTMLNEPHISVWRVTSKQFERPVNRRAAGEICGIRICLRGEQSR